MPKLPKPWAALTEINMAHFPVTDSTLSASHLRSFLQDSYNVSPEATCRLVRTGINHSYVVTDGAVQFVFRIYSVNWRSKIEIAEEVRLLLHLNENDVPVSFPIADASGGFIQSFPAPEGLRYGVLFSFAHGEKQRVFSAETSYHIGVAMGRLHIVTQDYAVKRVTYNSQGLLLDPLNFTKAFFTQPSGEMTFVESATHFLVREFEKVDISQVRSGVVHLDIWFDNMHIDNSEKITFFDFDFFGNGWQCLDIAYFVLQLFNTNPDQDQFLLKLNQFMAGYETMSTISDEEKRILPMAGLGIWLFYLGVQCQRFDNWSNIFLGEEHLKRFIAMIKKWCDYQRLVF